LERAARKKILIICAPDGFSNSVRPSNIKAYLEDKGHEVELLGILGGHDSKRWKEFARKVTPRVVWQYGSYVLLRARARRLQQIIRKKRPDILICETHVGAYVLTKKLPCITVYDAPTPLADELYFGEQLSRNLYALYRRMELEVFNSVDFLSFYWESYSDYIKKRYAGRYTGENMLVLNWGCAQRPRHATFKRPARIVYLGHLGGYWINLPLLAALSEQYPIDVYGEPPPDEKWGLNYRGYAHPDVLTEYQFGLITITNDELRREGFSAKHLEYVSYGLPVLCPEWRDDRRLADVTIPFNEANFLAQIDRFSEPEAWHAKHTKCVETAEALSWERQLRPLDAVVDASNGMPGRNAPGA
jgi:hypothetical protein